VRCVCIASDSVGSNLHSYAPLVGRPGRGCYLSIDRMMAVSSALATCCWKCLEVSMRASAAFFIVAAFNEDLGDGGEVEPGEVVPEGDPVNSVVVADWHRRAGEERRPDVAAEPL